jgi:23S rRNA U2552 (ribose-2'-O)-methylase RlmE/FtsJ
MKVQLRVMAADLEAINMVLERLKKEFRVVYVSKPYRNRKQRGYRVYVTAWVVSDG